MTIDDDHRLPGEHQTVLQGYELCIQLQDISTTDVISVWLNTDAKSWPTGLVSLCDRRMCNHSVYQVCACVAMLSYRRPLICDDASLCLVNQRCAELSVCCTFLQVCGSSLIEVRNVVRKLSKNGRGIYIASRSKGIADCIACCVRVILFLKFLTRPFKVQCSGLNVPLLNPRPNASLCLLFALGRAEVRVLSLCAPAPVSNSLSGGRHRVQHRFQTEVRAINL